MVLPQPQPFCCRSMVRYAARRLSSCRVACRRRRVRSWMQRGTWQLGTVHCVACICSSIHMRLQAGWVTAGWWHEQDYSVLHQCTFSVAGSCTPPCVHGSPGPFTLGPSTPTADQLAGGMAFDAPQQRQPVQHQCTPDAHRQYWQLPASFTGQFMA